MATKTKRKEIKPVRFVEMPDGSRKAMYRIADLTLDPDNARKHTERDLTATGDSIEQFKQVKPVVFDKDGIVRAGNGTCLALVARGDKEVWAESAEHLQGAMAMAYALADNRTAENSFWNYQQVAENLKAIKEGGYDTARLGWAEHELEPLLQAEWKPPDQEALDGFNRPDGEAPKTHTITLTADEYAQVARAINLRKNWMETNIGGFEDATEGEILASICVDWENYS